MVTYDGDSHSKTIISKHKGKGFEEKINKVFVSGGDLEILLNILAAVGQLILGSVLGVRENETLQHAILFNVKIFCVKTAIHDGICYEK